MIKQTIRSELRCDLRSFALMIESGVSLVRSLSILEESEMNSQLRSVLKEVRTDVESGATLSQAMTKHEEMFPPLLIGLVRAGEIGGVLEVTLRRAADYADREALLCRFENDAEAYRTFQLSQWSFEMGCMLTSGVPILQALQTVAENCEPQELREATVFMRTSIREGDRLSTVMERYPEVFPPLVRQIVTIGEDVGKLEILCLRLADHLEQIAEDLLTRGAQPPSKEPEGVKTEEPQKETVTEQGKDSQVLDKVHEILAAAIEAQASDMHLQPAQRGVQVRFRVDGVLRPGPFLGRDLYQSMLSRLKVLAGLEVMERRIPQRGRLSHRICNQSYDLRVSTFPEVYGESVSLRLLTQNEQVGELRDLGWEFDQLQQIQGLLKQPCGIIVVAGPQGSGRTTTLYSLLEHLNSAERSLVTVEESLGREVPGVQQAVVSRQLDLTPETMLRSLLRLDPDILMVDEVRDGDTLRQVVDAALTGHLLLVGLSSHDAATAVEKLVALASEPALLAEALVAVVAQRLVRKVCEGCASEVESEVSLASRLGVEAALLAKGSLRRGLGCEACGRTGVKGRAAAFEILSFQTGRMRRLVSEDTRADQLRRRAQDEGFSPMRESVAAKALRGIVSPEEAICMLRAVSEC